MNQQKLAKSMEEMAAYRVRSISAAMAKGNEIWTLSRVLIFAKDLSAHFAMAMPELLAECDDRVFSTDKEIAQASKHFDDQVKLVFGTSIVGVQPGDSV